MKLASIKNILLLGLASLAGANPHNSDDIFSVGHNDKGQLSKIRRFNIELDCIKNQDRLLDSYHHCFRFPFLLNGQRTQVSLSCGLISSTSIPHELDHLPEGFSIELKSPAKILYGHRIELPMLEPIAISRSEIPDGAERLAVLAHCVRIRKWEWDTKKKSPGENIEILCDMLRTLAVDKHSPGELKINWKPLKEPNHDTEL